MQWEHMYGNVCMCVCVCVVVGGDIEIFEEFDKFLLKNLQLQNILSFLYHSESLVLSLTYEQVLVRDAHSGTHVVIVLCR
jgi:hypothetical protein